MCVRHPRLAGAAQQTSRCRDRSDNWLSARCRPPRGFGSAPETVSSKDRPAASTLPTSCKAAALTAVAPRQRVAPSGEGEEPLIRAWAGLRYQGDDDRWE